MHPDGATVGAPNVVADEGKGGEGEGAAQPSHQPRPTVVGVTRLTRWLQSGG